MTQITQCKYTFNKPVIATFKKREKRFFSYFTAKNGEELIAHCVNTGKMAGILLPGHLAVLSSKNSGNLSYTWEAIKVDHTWVGTNTHTPNKLVEQLITTSVIPELNKEIFKREVTFKFPEKTYRADFASDNTVIEVKHVHWVQGDVAYFPDCIAQRSSEQIDILIKLKNAGKRVIIIYIVQRNDVHKFSVDPNVDSTYYHQVLKAKKANLEFKAFNAVVNENSVTLNQEIEILI